MALVIKSPIRKHFTVYGNTTPTIWSIQVLHFHYDYMHVEWIEIINGTIVSLKHHAQHLLYNMGKWQNKSMKMCIIASFLRWKMNVSKIQNYKLPKKIEWRNNAFTELKQYRVYTQYMSTQKICLTTNNKTYSMTKHWKYFIRMYI